jgi:ParB-like chromosome segregation protein Spo0J
LKTENRVIPLSAIDFNDRTCLLWPHVAVGRDFLQSIENVGLINPPLLVDKKDGTYSIVCGFRRVRACEMLGWREINVQILQGQHTLSDLLQIAIWDNRSHRTLNVVEQARGIRALDHPIPHARSVEFFSTLLGFPPNKKVFQKIERIGWLPKAIQAGLIEAKISIEAAVSLGELASEDAILIYRLLANLKMSQNKEKEVVMLIGEIAAMEELKISDVLYQLDIPAIMENENFNRNEKGAKIRRKLKQRRFPAVYEAEMQFKKTLKELRLDSTMHISPPPFFEGQSYGLHFNFENLNDLHDCQKRLDALIANPTTEKLLKRTV